MKKSMIVGLTGVFMLFMAVLISPAHAVTVVGGYTFDDNAFADSVISSSGTFQNNSMGTLSSSQLAAVLTDKDAATYAYSFSPGAYVQMGFTDNFLVNGSGNDLAIFDVGTPDVFKVFVTLGGTTIAYNSISTGFTVLTPENVTYGLNVALVNLDDFGIGAGSLMSSIGIGMDFVTNSGTVPSLSLVGALNSQPAGVPEPTTMLLVGLGLMGLAGVRRKF